MEEKVKTDEETFLFYTLQKAQKNKIDLLEQ